MARLPTPILTHPVGRWGEWLRYYLEDRELSRYRLAAHIDHARGAAPKTFPTSRISQWLNGERRVGPDDAFRVGQILRQCGAPVNGLLALYAAGHIVDAFGLLVHSGSIDHSARARVVRDFCAMPRAVGVLDSSISHFADSLAVTRNDSTPFISAFNGFEEVIAGNVVFEIEPYETAWSRWLRYRTALGRRDDLRQAQRILVMLRTQAASAKAVDDVDPQRWAEQLDVNSALPFHDYLLWMERAQEDIFKTLDPDEQRNDPRVASRLQLNDLLCLDDDDAEVLVNVERLTAPFILGMQLLAYVQSLRSWDEFSAARTWRIFGEWAYALDQVTYKAAREQLLPPACGALGFDPFDDHDQPPIVRM